MVMLSVGGRMRRLGGSSLVVVEVELGFFLLRKHSSVEPHEMMHRKTLRTRMKT